MCKRDEREKNGFNVEVVYLPEIASIGAAAAGAFSRISR
jgi:hypothetical protein